MSNTDDTGSALNKHLKYLDAVTDLQPSDTEPSVGNSKAQLIRNLVDLYDEYRKYHINQWRAGKHLTLSFDGFISYLRGQL